MLRASEPLNPHLSAMQMVESPRRVKRVAKYLLGALVLTVLGMGFVPWQQNIRGYGKIVAADPNERPQTVEAPIYGRVVRWGEGILEGAYVQKGQMILEIRDIDPERGDRLMAEVRALRDKLMLSETKAETYGRQAVDLEDARRSIIESYQQLVEEARRKLDAERHGLDAAQAALRQTESNYLRQKKLYEAGYTAGTSYEKERRSYEEAQAKVLAAEKYVAAAEAYLKSKQAELSQKDREAQTKVDYARAMQQEALGEAATARKELVQTEGKQAQFESRIVTAPRDGRIMRLFAYNEAAMLKEGDPLFTIVPVVAPTKLAVELWIHGNDVPLVTRGRHARLQFEGWPAVQFAAGWPEVSLGTFGGVVTVIDPTDDGQGNFRILVAPDPDDQPWPVETAGNGAFDPRFLRQGVRANGWVLLERVPLGYEIWRQINGFPPVYGGESKDEGKASRDKDVKKVKLPK
jgi:multidrug efflux pump subunit AcrA (membrane-fusion protein)